MDLLILRAGMARVGLPLPKALERSGGLVRRDGLDHGDDEQRQADE